MPTDHAPLCNDIASITRTNLHDSVVMRLRDMIVEGHLQPGSRVRERELCEQLAVSRTPLREALKVLASEGLVTLLPHHGSTITKLSPREVRDTLEVMGHLEAMAGELACERATEAEIAQVLAIHATMLQYYSERRLLDYFKANQAIHDRIVVLANNTALSHIHPILSARMRRMRYLGNEHTDRWERALAEHQEFMQSLLRRDGKALGAQLRQHLDNTWKEIEQMLDTLNAAVDEPSAKAQRRPDLSSYDIGETMSHD